MTPVSAIRLGKAQQGMLPPVAPSPPANHGSYNGKARDRGPWLVDGGHVAYRKRSSSLREALSSRVVSGRR